MIDRLRLQEYLSNDILHFGFKEEVQYVLFPFLDPYTKKISASHTQKTGMSTDHYTTTKVTVFIDHTIDLNEAGNRKTWFFPNTTIADFLDIFIWTAQKHHYPTEPGKVKSMLWELHQIFHGEKL